ncbi:hypothetical protein [Arthrobacter livingstonensis]|uniref:hypothetical protein n=1 Tax=Arthrobacter livingstonensis TaxID=670078 RepID=UPI001FE4F408|nr:hypothetical protein [Arthrobacter livingstonensis]
MEIQDAREHMSIVIRPYEDSDAAQTLVVFTSAVIETASADYTAAQYRHGLSPSGAM